MAHLFTLESTRDRPYTEALFTTFNVDLGFFETRVLGLVRTTGAAVTVLADAGIYAPDPRSVKGAGAAYLVGLADMPGAFHPKVTVLVGPDQVLVAIGSGNLTTGGWVGNDETLIVATGSLQTGVPALVGQVAEWLRTLDRVRMGRLARDAITRTAGAIERLTASADVTDTGHTLVTTSTRPILDQLPNEHVADLWLYAPFHDPQGAALEALIDRYRPQRIHIAVQSGRTIIQPSVLTDVATRGGITLDWQDAGETYRHGKVLEAITGTHHWTLTGSPNLTAAALLRPLGAGGNCEVGVLHYGAADLYPGTGPALVPASIRTVSIQAAPGEGPAAALGTPRLLGASLVDGSLHIELARPAPVELEVQLSPFDDLPEDFTVVGHVSAGACEATLNPPQGLNARARVRLAWIDSGMPVWSQIVFVSDPHAVLHRLAAPSTTRTNTDAAWTDLFGNGKLQDDWTRQIDKVMRDQRAIPLPRVTSVARTARIDLKPADGWRTVNDTDAWAQYAQDAVDRLGPSIAYYASGGLILPHLGSSSSRVSETIWDDKFDITSTEFDDEHSAEEQDDQAPADGSDETKPEPTSSQRARLRRWLERLTADMSDRPAIDRCAFVHLALIGTHLNIWDTGPAPWFELLAHAAEQLTAEDVPPMIEAELGSLAAVCLYRLDQGADPDRRTGTGSRYGEVTKALLPAARSANPQRVADLLQALHGDAALAPSAEAVMDHLSNAINPDPWPEAVRLIGREHPEWYVELERNGVIYIEGKFTNPLRAAAQALLFAPRGTTAAVRAQPAHGAEATVIRHEETLTVKTSLNGHPQWKTYRIGGLVNPMSIADDPDTARRMRIDPPPWSTPSEVARAAFAAAGLQVTACRA